MFHLIVIMPLRDTPLSGSPMLFSASPNSPLQAYLFGLSCCHTLCNIIRVWYLSSLNNPSVMSAIEMVFLDEFAYIQAVNLSASSFYVPSNNFKSYVNYVAAVSEVEIDLLTGETRFLQTDITYDCGHSLNPAVDLG